MRSSFRIAIALLAAVLVAASVSAQSSKGKAELVGRVLDEKSQPIADATVRAQMVGAAEPFTGKTNAKGEFKLKALANGQWNIEIVKQGFVPVKQTLEVKADKTLPITATLAVDHTNEINAELQKAVSLAQGGKFAEARQVCESVLASYPLVTQCYAFNARMYAAEGQAAKGVEQAKLAIEKDPNNPENKVLLGDLLMEAGQKAEALQLLTMMDLTVVKDPYPFLNAAITLINDKKGEEAVALLTKMEPVFKETPEIYYYRGRAYVAANKFDQAKADFEKFVTIGKPDSKEVADAKKILDQLNKK